MKAVFSVSKISNKSQRLLRQTGALTSGYNLPRTSSSCVHVVGSPFAAFRVPSLIHLSVIRTLATLRPRKTHYEVLNLTSSATAKDIRLAFLKLSKQCHPDTSKNPNNNHKSFVQVKEAYTVLSRSESRLLYDASLRDSHHVNAGTAHSYGFGSHPQSGQHYTHYKTHNYNETDWIRNSTMRSNTNIFNNFYTLTACITCAAVGLIIFYMEYYFPDTRLKGLRNNLRSQELEQHDLIMTSQHEGSTVYYYAVPKITDPESYEVLAVTRSQAKDSDLQEMQGLNSVEYSKQNTLQ